MSISLVIFVGILAVFLLAFVYFIVIYNQLVAIKNNISKSWSNIDVLLKQRHDELIKLVEVCKQYLGYEKNLQTQITQLRAHVDNVDQARNRVDIEALGKTEIGLRKSLSSLFAVAENYPDLKANQNFLQLQGRVSDLENAIADRREYYNESVNINNIRIDQFPDLIVARCLNFGPAKLLQFSAEEIANPDLQALFK